MQQTLGIARNVGHQDMLVVLRRIGAQLQIQQQACLVNLATTLNDVAGVDALAAAGQGAMAETVSTILDEDIIDTAVVGIFIGPGALTTLQCHGIVIDREVAVLDQHIVADIQIDGVGRGRLHGLVGRHDRQIGQFEERALIVVGAPEGRIFHRDAIQTSIRAVRQIDQTGA